MAGGGGVSHDLILALDTSTRTSIVALGAEELLAVSRRQVQHRHGSHVLEQIDEVLGAAGCSLADIGALAVGTGPGSFTGLRVGLATAKTIAYARDVPIVGVLSADALRLAATDAGAAAGIAVVLPAGAHDHYLARPGVDPVLVAPGDLLEILADEPALTVDMDPSLLGEEAARIGAAAGEALPRTLLQLARGRIGAGQTDDLAELTPAYVALPRGVQRAPEELGWSPDLR
jgi:tRNA threonylcarbamoyl adenosine modification protein YeaZ